LSIGVVAALFLLGVGAAIGSGEEDHVKTQVTDLESEVTIANNQQHRAEEETSDALSKVSRVQGLRGKIVGEAKEQAEKIVGDAKGEAEELASVDSEIEEAEGHLESVQASIGGAKEEAAKSRMGDGIWQGEVDYIPGTYRAPGGEGCYWATLNSANTGDIADNEVSVGSGSQQIATINTPYFQSKDCGTWERIGE
jgi:hypothetical protein